MFALHVYSMILQWIGVMQHRLGCVAPEEGQHVSSMHLPSNLSSILLTMRHSLTKYMNT